MTPLLTICHGCGTISDCDRGYCPQCKPAQQRQRNQQPTRRMHRTKTHSHVRRIVWTRDPHECRYCHLPLEADDWTLDYVVPLIRGGRQHSDNAVIACRPCNSSKGARDATAA